VPIVRYFLKVEQDAQEARGVHILQEFTKWTKPYHIQMPSSPLIHSKKSKKGRTFSQEAENTASSERGRRHAHIWCNSILDVKHKGAGLGISHMSRYFFIYWYLFLIWSYLILSYLILSSWYFLQLKDNLFRQHKRWFASLRLSWRGAFGALRCLGLGSQKLERQNDSTSILPFNVILMTQIGLNFHDVYHFKTDFI